MSPTNRGSRASRSDVDAAPSDVDENGDPPFDRDLGDEVMADIYKEISDALDAPLPEGWNPEPGSKLIGTITELSTANAGGYGDYPLVTVKKEDGEIVAAHAFHSVLSSALMRAKVVRMVDIPGRTDGAFEWVPNDEMIGRRIGILCEGKAQAKTVRKGKDDEYHVYRVVVR